MHDACYSAKATRSSASKAKNDQTDQRPDQKRNPKTRRNKGRGWVRIRDIKSPKFHTPPQPMPSVASHWPIPGVIGVLLLQFRPLGVSCEFSMLNLRPLAGVHSIFGGCIFVSALLPFRVLLLLMSCSNLDGSVACMEFADSNSQIECRKLSCMSSNF